MALPYLLQFAQIVCSNLSQPGDGIEMADKRIRRYTVSTEIVFSASHTLDEHPGECSRLHGHNWTVRVYYSFESPDSQGITVDFMTLRSALEEELLPRFDHANLNDIPPFDSVSPTSENLAAEIYRICRENLRFEGGTIHKVELWETPTDMVSYREG
jgi:6-pyruvoyltetrahydropterin/6-carboxytetrahydropterin synthase